MECKNYWNFPSVASPFAGMKFPERTLSGKKTWTDAMDTTPCTPASIAAKVPEMLAKRFAVTAVENTPHKTTLAEKFESLGKYCPRTQQVKHPDVAERPATSPSQLLQLHSQK
jgi:hypothetical protein